MFVYESEDVFFFVSCFLGVCKKVSGCIDFELVKVIFVYFRFEKFNSVVFNFSIVY